MPDAKSFPGNSGMTCEEFALAALDLDLVSDSPAQQAAREHLRVCSHCAALQAQWQSLRAELRSLGQETARAASPARVEMRLRQEFRTKHKTRRTQRAAVAATWALAAAAVLLVAFSWLHWRSDRSAHQLARVNNSAVPSTGALDAAELGETVVASNDSGDFTLLPGSMPSVTEDATVVHVQMQRAALGTLGFAVNEEHAGDWIQVDLLVGDDGLPQAVRLPQSSN
jgi:predicted anti-sigma-YlaC factor YlaD